MTGAVFSRERDIRLFGQIYTPEDGRATSSGVIGLELGAREGSSAVLAFSVTTRSSAQDFFVLRESLERVFEWVR